MKEKYGSANDPEWGLRWWGPQFGCHRWFGYELMGRIFSGCGRASGHFSALWTHSTHRSSGSTSLTREALREFKGERTFLLPSKEFPKGDLTVCTHDLGMQRM
jgi:hypothetical protein